MSINKLPASIPRDWLVAEWLLDWNWNDTSWNWKNWTPSNITWTDGNIGFQKQYANDADENWYIAIPSNIIQNKTKISYALWFKANVSRTAWPQYLIYYRNSNVWWKNQSNNLPLQLVCWVGNTIKKTRPPTMPRNSKQ